MRFGKLFLILYRKEKASVKVIPKTIKTAKAISPGVINSALKLDIDNVNTPKVSNGPLMINPIIRVVITILPRNIRRAPNFLFPRFFLILEAYSKPTFLSSVLLSALLGVFDVKLLI